MPNAAQWPNNIFVSTTQLGTPIHAANVLRVFRHVPGQAGREAPEMETAWTEAQFRGFEP
jgi:hypothetical protein